MCFSCNAVRPWTWSSCLHHVFFPSSQMVTTAPAAGKRTVPQVASPETEPGECPPTPASPAPAAPKHQWGRCWHPCGYLGAWLSRRPSSGLGSHGSLLGRSRSCLSRVPLPPQSSEAGRRPWVRAPALCSRRWTALGPRPPSPASLVPGQPRAPRWEPRRQVRWWHSAGGVGSRF